MRSCNRCCGPRPLHRNAPWSSPRCGGIWPILRMAMRRGLLPDIAQGRACGGLPAAIARLAPAHLRALPGAMLTVTGAAETFAPLAPATRMQAIPPADCRTPPPRKGYVLPLPLNTLGMEVDFYALGHVVGGASLTGLRTCGGMALVAGAGRAGPVGCGPIRIWRRGSPALFRSVIRIWRRRALSLARHPDGCNVTLKKGWWRGHGSVPWRNWPVRCRPLPPCWRRSPAVCRVRLVSCDRLIWTRRE